MRGPRRNTEREMLEKLRYGGVVDGDGLTEAEARLVSESAELDRELRLNQVLQASGFTGPETPQVAAGLSAAIAAADRDTAWEDQGTMRSLLVGKKWYWQAAIIAVAVVLVVVAAAIWPWRVNVTPRGGIGVGNQAAWATVDGYLVEYRIEFTELYTGTVDDSPEHPMCVMRETVTAWAEANATALESGPAESPVELHIEKGLRLPRDGTTMRSDGSDSKYEYTIQLTVLTEDRDLVDGLVAELEQIEGLETPEVFSHQWFYLEKYPELRYEGREVCINGEVLSYPQDVNENDLSLMAVALNVMPVEAGWLYYALDDIEEFQRYGLGDIVRLSWEDGGRINIDNTTCELDFAGLGLPGWIHTMSMYVPAGETELDLDIPGLIIKHAARMKMPYNNSCVAKGERIIVDLLPRESWSGLAGEDLPGEFTADDTSRAMQDLQRCDRAIEDLLREYPDAREFITPVPVERAGVPVQWTVVVHGRTYRDLAPLVLEAVAEACPGEVVTVPAWNLPVTGDKSQVEITNTKPQIYVSKNVLVQLLPVEDEHGRDPYLAVKRASTAELERVKSAAGRLEKLVGGWSDRQAAEAGDFIRPEINFSETEGVKTSAFIEFEEDGEYLDVLAEALGEAGFKDVRVNRPVPRIEPTGLTVQVGFFTPDRFRGIDPDEAAKVLVEEAGMVDGLVARFKDVLEEFKLAHDAGEPGSGAAVQVRFYGSIYGNLINGQCIQTNLAYGPVVDDLVARMEDAGFVKVKVVEPWTYDAGEPSAESIAGKTAIQSDDWKKSLLRYNLPTADWQFSWSWLDEDEMYTEEECRASHELAERMQAALDAWLAEQPEDMEVSLRLTEYGGAVNQIRVLCSQIDEETMFSLAEALDVEGAPVYRYGSGFMNRHVDWDFNNRKMQQYELTYVGLSLLPQVRTMAAMGHGDYVEALHEEFTEEEIAAANETGRLVRRVFEEWLKLHPELNEPIVDIPNIRAKKAEIVDIPRGDVMTLVNINIYVGDLEREMELARELMDMLAEAGVEIQPYTGHRYDSYFVKVDEGEAAEEAEE